MTTEWPLGQMKAVYVGLMCEAVGLSFVSLRVRSSSLGCSELQRLRNQVRISGFVFERLREVTARANVV